MTLSLLELLSIVLVPLLLGAAALRCCGVVPRTDPLAYGGWCMLGGSVALAIVLTGWLWLELPLRSVAIVPVLLGLAALLLLLGRRVPPVLAWSTSSAPRWERASFVLVVAVLLGILVWHIVLASGTVIAHSDEGNIWAAKAKILFLTGGFGADFHAAIHQRLLVDHAEYPPLNPLLQLWVFVHAGEILHVENRLPIQLFGPALVLVAASALRRRTRPIVAAFFLAAMVATDFAAFSMRSASADLLIAFGLLLSWDLWQRFQEDGQAVWWKLWCLSAVLLVWSKNEGRALVVIFFFALACTGLTGRIRLPRKSSWLFALPLVASLAYLSWFNAHFELEGTLMRFSSSGREPGVLQRVFTHGPQRAGTVLASFAAWIASSRTHYLLLLFLVLCVLRPRLAWRADRRTFSLALALALIAYMGVYLGTDLELERHLETSLRRVIHHLVPAAGLWVLLVLVDLRPGLAPAGSGPPPG